MAAEENVSASFEFGCDLSGHGRNTFEGLFHVGGEHFQFVHDLCSELLGGVEVFVLSEPDGDEVQYYNLANESLGTGDREFSAAVQKDTTVVFSGERRVNLVDDIDSCQTVVGSLSEWDEEIHGLATLRNADEATVGLRKVSVIDFTRDQGFDIFKASELFHEVFSVLAGKVGCSTSGDYEVVDLAELFPASVHTTELDHVVSAHESGTVVESSSDGLWLFKHLHHVVMWDAWWKTDFDALLDNGLDLGLLDLVLQTESQDFFVFDVVEVLGVILEDGGVRRDNLELMLFSAGFFFFLVITAKFTQRLN